MSDSTDLNRTYKLINLFVNEFSYILHSLYEYYDILERHFWATRYIRWAQEL
jgi:siderophore synthetase component